MIAESLAVVVVTLAVMKRQSDLSGWRSMYPFNPKLFVIPPWWATFTSDSERNPK